MPGSHYLMDPNAMDRLGFIAQKDIWDNMSGNASGLMGVTALRGLTPLNQNNWKLVLRDTLQSRMDTVLARAKEFGEPKIPDDISLRIIRMLGTDYLLLEGDDWEVPGYELWRTDLALPYHDGLCAYRAENGWVPDAWFVEEISDCDEIEFAGFIRWLGTENLDVGLVAIRKIIHVETPSWLYEGRGVITTRTIGPSIVKIGNILAREEGNNWVKYKVAVEGTVGGFLVTGQNYYPGWNVYIDGEYNSHNYSKTNLLMSGVYVPPGEHIVELRYQPNSVLIGAFTSLSGLIIWAILMGLVIWIHRRDKTSIVPQTEKNGPGDTES